MKKAINLITNNFGLKILAIVFAVIVWMIVVNVDDPETSKQFSVAVSVENENVITDMGKVYEVLDGSDVAVFTVTASRSVVEQLTSADFKATADMSQIEGMSLVPIEVSALKYASRVTIQKKTQNMQVSIEELKSSQFVITAEYEGVPAGGCAVGEVGVTPNVITVTGAESVVSGISKVVATINVNGMSTDITDRVVPALYDEEGRSVSAENLTFSQDAVTISATIENKKEVPVEIEIGGTPADGYAYTGAACDPETLVVQGEAAELNNLDSVVIPADAVDVSGKNDDFTETVDITPYLPAGISLVDADTAEIAVDVKIEALSNKTFSVPVENLTVEKLPDDMEFKFQTNAVQVVLTGLSHYLNAVSADDIHGTVDASAVTEGVNVLEIDIECDNENVSVNGTPMVRIEVTGQGAQNNAGSAASQDAADTQSSRRTED